MAERASWLARKRTASAILRGSAPLCEIPASAVAPNEAADASRQAERVGVHAVALRALLTEAPNVLSLQRDSYSAIG